MSRRGSRLTALALVAALAGLVVPATPASADDLVPLPAPNQPVATQITPTGAVLSWTSGGGPVFRYSMKQLVNGVWQGYASMPGTSFTLAGLTPDTEYTFAVQAAPLAFSGYSMSPLSEPVTFRTLAVNWTCRVQVSAGNGFFTINATVHWTGTPPSPWRATFTLGENQSLTQGWNGSMSIIGRQVTVSGGSWGGLPPTVAPITFGAVGQYQGTFDPPRDFRFNGVPCETTVIVPVA